ncbi:MAG: DUF6588 family protein [Saprospiraceae bacterium]|nr:hypothetical protein [Saprospiraceae bacterium]MBK8448613.1 hypothetical protein [Saprospiraceae bacterium]MBK8482883.1 hypothetical protein [Saprospiraceae bacterium]
MYKSIFSLILQFLFIGILSAQGINEYAAHSYLRNGNAQAYMSPLVDLMGSSIHASSLSYVHPDTTRNFHLYIGIYGTAAFIPESMKSFNGITEAPFSPTKTLKAPTIFGDNNTQIIYDESGNAYTFPGGFDIKQINLVFPIIHVGTFFHTNFSGRFLAMDVGGDFKRIEVYGIGFNHFISDYWKAKNYFVSVGGSYNQFKLGDYLLGKNILAQITGGQQLGLFNYYVYGQWQKTPYEFYYEDEIDGNGTIEINGENEIRFGAGCGIKLWKFYLHAEASVFKPLVTSVGIGLQF